MIVNSKKEKRYRRHKRVRAKIFGTAKIARLCVFKTPKHIYAQLVDDEKGKTILSSSDLEIKKLKIKSPASAKARTGKQKSENENKTVKTAKVAIAYEVGKMIAKKAKEKKITKVVFDRGGYKYHGRVKAVAEGAREAGLEF